MHGNNNQQPHWSMFNRWSQKNCTAWKVSKYGVFSVPYFPVFGLNTRNYGPENTPQCYDQKYKLFRTNSFVFK